MKYLKFFNLITFFWFCFSGMGMTHAQQSHREQVYQAFISGQMDGWDKVIGELKNREVSLSSNQVVEFINYYYGYIGWAIAEGLNKKAGLYILEAEDLVDKQIAKQPEIPELYAYKGALLGYKITLNKLKAPFLGPESVENIDRAIETDSTCPQGWIEKGNALFYMPKMFGGSKEQALEAYNKAIRLMEKDPEMVNRNWMYLNVLMIMGQSYETTGNLQMAKISYEKVLRIEPDFKYMRDEIYPSFMKSWNSQ